MAQRFEFQLKKFFEKEKNHLIGDVNSAYPSYKSLIYRMKKGVRLDSAPSNKRSTIIAKGFDHWLVNTGETVRRGIVGRSMNNGFIVFASGQYHTGRKIYMGVPGGHKGQRRGVHRPHTEKRIVQSRQRFTYRQIFIYNNTANGRYSGIFGKLPAGSKLFDRLNSEMRKQVNKHVEKTVWGINAGK